MKPKKDVEPTDGVATKTWHNAAILYPFSPKEKKFSDQTGQFPFCLSRGNEYLMVMYDYDANAILVTPLKNHQAKTIATAWETLHSRLTKH